MRRFNGWVGRVVASHSHFTKDCRKNSLNLIHHIKPFGTMSNKEFDKYKPKDDMFDKYKSLNEYLKHDKKTIDNGQIEKFDKVVTLKVTKETFELWEQLCENWGEVLGYDNKSKIFEFAIVEALNVPIASLGGFDI